MTPCQIRLSKGGLYENMITSTNKVPYRAFSRQASQLILNIPILQGLLRVKNMRDVDKLKIMNYRLKKEIKRIVTKESLRA